MKSFLQVFNSKKIIILFLLITFIVSGFSVPSYAEETEQWEKDLTTCINQKKAASIHVSLDVSGSTETTDPNGVRGAATVAISLGLQKITKELQSSEYENVDMEISWSTFSSFGNVVLPWTNLSTSNLTKQQLDSEKILLNKSDGGTSYLEALYVVDTLFNTKKIQNSCEILIFMTDGATSDSYTSVLNKIDSFQSRGTYLIGVALDNSNKLCLDLLLGEVAGDCKLSDGTIEFSNNSIYLKSKVFLAKNATDVLNAFLKISNQLRASGFNQDKEDIDTEQTVICTEDKECFYELSLGVGTQTAIIQMNISDPGNVGDVELYIEPPPALNISDSFIGLTIIALGTSLPEIATSITAAKKGKTNMIIGNIIGSNIYNLLLILGFVSLFENFSYNKELLSKDVVFLVLTVLLFTVLIYKKINVGKKISFLCFSMYFIYMINLYITNF